jgi:hypothetical protein
MHRNIRFKMQFAQMRMKGARVHAQGALAKQAGIGRRW